MKTSFADTEQMQAALPPIVEFLEGSKGSVGELANETRAIPTTAARADFLSEPWSAPKGAPKALNGKPRVVAWVAMRGIYSMMRIRNKMVTSDWEIKNRMSYDRHFYYDMLKAGMKDDFAILEDLMPCFHGALSEARNEDTPGGNRWVAEKLLKNQLHPSGLFTFSQNRERFVLWAPLVPLLSVAGMGEELGVHPRSSSVSAALMR